MEYVYAALLLHKVKKEINEVSVKKVISATGVKADDVKVKALVSALDEVDINEALKNATLTQAVAAAPAAAAAPEEKKAEPAEEEKKEEALDGLSSLFG
ncbi:MAG: 50S ribosomal protein P1 [Nitrososphaerales archaeon]